MKTAVSDARRRVAEAQAQCEQQAELLGALEAQGAPSDAIEAAGRMLDMLDHVLTILRDHLQREEELQPDRVVLPPSNDNP